MKIIREIGTFKAGYSREGVISLVEAECQLCKKVKRCIYIDGSEGEYGGAAVCGDCAKRECDSGVEVINEAIH